MAVYIAEGSSAYSLPPPRWFDHTLPHRTRQEAGLFTRPRGVVFYRLLNAASLRGGAANRHGDFSLRRLTISQRPVGLFELEFCSTGTSLLSSLFSRASPPFVSRDMDHLGSLFSDPIIQVNPVWQSWTLKSLEGPWSLASCMPLDRAQGARKRTVLIL